MFVDYLPAIIVLAYMVVCIFLGFYAFQKSRAAGKVADSSDYFLAGRGIGSVLIALTYNATVWSALVFLGSVGIYWKLGIGFNIVLVSEMVAVAILIPTVGKVMWKLAHKYDYITPADIVAHRYGNDRVIRALVGVITVFFTLFFISAQILGLSYIMQSVTREILSPKLSILIVSVILVIYIVTGGFRAVTWTDAIQVIMVLGGIIATFVVVLVKFDLGSIFQGVQATRGGLFTTPGPIPVYKPGLWITSFFAIGLSFVFMPQLWVRVYASKSQRGLRNIVLYFIAGTAVMFFMTYVFSVICSQIYAGKEIAPDKLTLSLIFDHLPSWVAATILTGVVAASMSTVDSMVLCLSSIVVRDFYSKQFKPSEPKRMEAGVGRAVSVVVIGAAVYFAYFPPAKMLWGLLIDVMYPGIMSLIPATLIGLFWKKASRTGAIISLVAGAAFAMISIAYNVKPFGFHAAFWVLVVSAVTFFAGSLIWKPKPGKEIDLIATIRE